MKLNEVKDLKKAPKLTLAQRLEAVEVGKEPDDALKAVLQKMADKAEKELYRDVVNDPDTYGIDTYDNTKSEIRNGVNVWTMRIYLTKDGFTADLNLDTDDIGGESSDYYTIRFDAACKRVGEIGADVGEDDYIAMFDQTGWKREE
jgi:hypothetical protein